MRPSIRFSLMRAHFSSWGIPLVYAPFSIPIHPKDSVKNQIILCKSVRTLFSVFQIYIVLYHYGIKII